MSNKWVIRQSKPKLLFYNCFVINVHVYMIDVFCKLLLCPARLFGFPLFRLLVHLLKALPEIHRVH
jgi:hypothetical protein